MNNHDLDNQIREALRAEPSQQQIARLEDYWHERSKAVVADNRSRIRHIHHTRYWAAAVALAMLIVVGTSLCLLRHEPAQEPVVMQHPANTETTAPDIIHAEENDAVAVVKPHPKEITPSAGRAATAYERIVFTVSTHKSIAARQGSIIGKVDEAIAQLARETDAPDSAAMAKKLAQSLPRTGCDVERVLLRRLSRSKDDQKRAVVQLLGICGTRRSAPALLRLSSRKSFRGASLAAVEQIVGVDGLPPLVTQSNDRHVRAAILERILRADSEPALRGYLTLVRNEAFTEEALAVANGISGPLLQRLLDLLKDKNEDVRLAAAMVLGHANGPEVADALIKLVMTKKDATKKKGSTPSPDDKWISTEAWIAIMACRGRQAKEFLSYARCHPKLLGQYNRALARLAQITL